MVGNDVAAALRKTRRQRVGSWDDMMMARRLLGALDDGAGSKELFAGNFGSLTA
jgi:hypothetical protein